MKVWSGRFTSGPAELMERFSRSIDIDGLMWREDLAVNRAWAQALGEAKLLTLAEEKKIQRGLREIEKEFRTSRFVFLPADEDIHVATERRLTELIGATGAKIHTGRSRNNSWSASTKCRSVAARSRARRFRLTASDSRKRSASSA